LLFGGLYLPSFVEGFHVLIRRKHSLSEPLANDTAFKELLVSLAPSTRDILDDAEPAIIVATSSFC